MTKKKKVKKTNEERLLDDNHIEFEEKNYDWIGRREKALEDVVADGLDPHCVLKTIVLQANQDPKDYLVVCLPVEAHLNLKMIAHELGKKQLHLADNKSLIKITGYVHGANTPIGIHAYKGFPIYFDEQIKPYDKVVVSAGKLGRSVIVDQKKLLDLVEGKYIKVEC